MRFQLFVPPQGYVAQRWEQGTSMPPLGVLSLAAVLEKQGGSVEVVPADVLNYKKKDIEKRILEFNPHALGITTTTENRFDSFKLAALAKKINPEIVTVLGGPHVSMAREDTLKHVRDVDVAVIGEGEKTVLELAETIDSNGDLSQVKGILFRKNGDVIFTGQRERIEDLDALPYPARHLIPMEAYHFFVETRDGKLRKAQNVMTSRGCPFNCYFCATPSNWGRRMRGHSPERVVDEIEHLIDSYGAEFLWFYDDTFNYNPKRVHKIMDLILERGLDIKFCSEFRIDVVDRALLEKMTAAGLDTAHFGIEAGHSRVRKEIVKKEFDIEKASRFVQWAKELEFSPNAFLVFSHHTETWEEAQETIQVMDRLKSINPQTEFSASILHVYPGTPLEEIARREGIIPQEFSWSRKKDMRKVFVLPAGQGDVPLFKDRLTWFQIAELVMRWSSSEKKIISGSKIKSAVKTVTSVKDIPVYFAFFVKYLKYKLKKLFSWL
ncbi:MAG: radical SAM protein [Candidatus Aminicenantes bacterium]|nr:radical SAM protein [Candidatus Aminicenantes bacterium]